MRKKLVSLCKNIGNTGDKFGDEGTSSSVENLVVDTSITAEEQKRQMNQEKCRRYRMNKK